MNPELYPEFKEYLNEYQLQTPVEAAVQYEDGELEAEWLIAAGFPQLTKPFEEGKELRTSELESVISNLPKQHAEAINHRVRALNKTVRGRSKHRYKRKPDIRDVFRDIDDVSVGTRSRSATPDSLDSVPGEENWNQNDLSCNGNTSLNQQCKQNLQRTPSAPHRGSTDLFRGSNVRCDIPFLTADGIKLLGFQKIGTVHIPRIRSGSDPSCSIGRHRGNVISSSRSHNNLLSDSPPGPTFGDSFSQIQPQRTENEPISFENLCRQTNLNYEWEEINEPRIDINDISEADLRKLQQFCWLEIAALFDKHHVVLDKRKPFKRKRKEEGNLFGISLNTLIRRDQQVTGEDSTLVPLIIQIILNELIRRGSNEEGILRVGGHKQKIEVLYQELESMFYQKPQKGAELLSHASVHDISALLKRLLRELPQPLLATDLIHLFYQTYSIPPPDQLMAISTIFLLLPHENRNTVRAILSFLNVIIGASSVNKMNKHNVATIFAPSFFPPRFIHPVDKNNIESQVKMAAACCELTKVLITRNESLFMVPKKMIDQSRCIKSGQNKRARDFD